MALFVIGLLTVMGVALLLLSQTEVRSSAADARGKLAFYLGEAGVETGRSTLRYNNLLSANRKSLDDELTAAAGANGVIDFDPGMIKGVYNAAGALTSLTGFGDDVPLVAPTPLGDGWFSSFLLNDGLDGTTNLNDTNARVAVVGVGAGPNRSFEVVEAIVERRTMPLLPAAITILGPTPIFDGGTLIDHRFEGDDCQSVGGYTPVPGLSVPTVGVIGAAAKLAAQMGVHSPPSYDSGGSTGIDTIVNVQGTIDPAWLDCPGLLQMAREIRSVADVVCTGSCALPAPNPANIVFVDGDFTLGSTVVNRGLLWVTGDLSIDEHSHWTGTIIAAGTGVVSRFGAGYGFTNGATLVASISGPDGIMWTADDCSGADGVLGTPDDGAAPATYTAAGGGGSFEVVYCRGAASDATDGLPCDVTSFRHR